ncbi:MAG: hypothetical protein AAF449_02600 [Myxococcota bacterium]
MTQTKIRWPGWRALRQHWRAAIFLYLTTVMVSAPAAAGLGFVMHDYFGERAAGSKIAARLSAVELAEVIMAKPSVWTMLAIVAVLSAVGWYFLQTFVWGAVLASRGRPSPSVRGMMTLGGHHVWGLLGLSILGIPFVAVVAIASLMASMEISKMLTDGATSEATVLATQWSLFTVALILVVWASATHDLMRARKIEGAGVLNAFGGGLLASLRRPVRLLWHGLPWVVSAWALTVGLTWFDAQQPWTSGQAIVFSVVIQQSLVLARAFLRIAGLVSIQDLVPAEPT